MKRKSILTALLLSCGLLPALAQKGPHIGITTGYNSTWVMDQKLFDDPNYEYRKTWNSAPFGVALGYKVNANTDLQVEINKTNMGAEYDIIQHDFVTGNTTTVGKKEIKTQYWSVPVMYKFTTVGQVRFNFHVGPQFNFLTNGSEVNTINQQATLKADLQSTDLTSADAKNNPSKVSVKDAQLNLYTYQPGTYTRADKSNFNKTDIGVAIGLGMEVDITKNLYATGNLRFYYGLNDIRSEERVKEAEARSNYDSRNNIAGGVQAGLHYRFGK